MLNYELEDDVLIPSFSGVCFKQPARPTTEPARPSLNPFFFRGVFQAALATENGGRINVLIPSFSGVCFKPILAQLQAHLIVLIPSFSGVCFKQF